MVASKDSLFERFLAPLWNLFIDTDQLQQLRDRIDWSLEIEAMTQPNVTYPSYYHSNFHGISGGYLTIDAAVTYDPVTRYALPPNETWVRQELVDVIPSTLQPQRILDLACGTGSTTVLLKQAFPQAAVTGLDLSPYMLVIADQKAKQADQTIQWVHGNAESTPYPAASFDLVTASLLLHELPPAASKQVLQEAARLLKPGGLILILDGNQKTLQQAEWLMTIFEEPFIQDYATSSSIDAWLGLAGFDLVRTHEVWWLHQISIGIKPMPVTEYQPTDTVSYDVEHYSVACN